MSVKQFKNIKRRGGISTPIKRLVWVRDHTKSVITCYFKGKADL